MRRTTIFNDREKTDITVQCRGAGRLTDDGSRIQSDIDLLLHHVSVYVISGVTE